MRMTLKEARLKRDLKQSEIAQIMGVSTSAVCQWETEATGMSIDKFNRLCEVLRVSRDDIILPK